MIKLSPTRNWSQRIEFECLVSTHIPCEYDIAMGTERQEASQGIDEAELIQIIEWKQYYVASIVSILQQRNEAMAWLMWLMEVGKIVVCFLGRAR